MKEIEIIIGPDGETEIDLKGYHGQGCSEVTDQLVKALAGEKAERVKKAEYYKPKVKETVKQRL